MVAMAAAYFPMLKEMYPEAAMIFNTRHHKAAIKSYMQVQDSFPAIAVKLGVMKRVF